MVRKEKNAEIITNHRIMKCWTCEGYGGYYLLNNPNKRGFRKMRYKTCPACKGKGTFTEKHYFIIDKKNKIAFSGDTIK
ncbi:MAG: hypothetical protein ACTSPD_10140 [Promethearchaeota archaeon]